jgi:hypothetical protein
VINGCFRALFKCGCALPQTLNPMPIYDLHCTCPLGVSMRSMLVALLSGALLFAFAEDADARGGRGGGGFGGRTVHVNGYTRSNGTYVAPHNRSAPGTRGAVFVGTAAAAGLATGTVAAISGSDAAGLPLAEPEAPLRPWCADGKIVAGLCALN